MQHIVYNLLSNSLKYTEQGGVELSASYSADCYLTLVVSDSGVGIAAEELPYVFDRYYQASNAVDNSVAGTGIGLNMVKDLVELMNGKIDVESTVGVGTSFTVRLPLVSAEDKEEELLPESPVIPKLPSLLLVDDNDDMRDFLVHELKDDYNILQARNGREALRIAQTHYVDVVLSDVMMPQMDGNELCRRLKEDESTSHIFVILITAKTAEESMLHSYESGADFYLTKPFSMALLRNRLSHLANMQEQRIMMLSKVEDVKDSDSADDELRISPVDRKFMTSIKQTMDQYVADSSFSVDVFCNELGMSRMNFYRKMRALTGKTPAQYINEYRLALADKLLHEGELNVSEVANRTGFTTPSYFSKCYKAKYGVVPKDVRS
jgi:DNA-binding response OmpR family regulator